MKIARAALALEIETLNAAERNAAGDCMSGGLAAAVIFMGRPRSCASALAVPMGKMARAGGCSQDTWAMLWIVPSPPQAKIVSHPASHGLPGFSTA